MSGGVPGKERLAAVKAVILDVDGVLTDGRLWVMEGGDSGHAFHVRDGLALVDAAAHGLPVGVITGRRSVQVARRLRELRVHHIHQGVADKSARLDELCAQLNVSPAQVAYVGDDVNDVPVLARVGLPCTPADGLPEVRAMVERSGGWVLSFAGGQGAVRQLLQAVMEAQGSWPWNVPA